MDQSFRLVHWLSITLSLRKTQSRIHQFGKKVLPGLFLGYALGDILVAHIEETMDASEIYYKRLHAKEVICSKEHGKFIFPAADGRIKLSGGDQELRTHTLIREPPNPKLETIPAWTLERVKKTRRRFFSKHRERKESPPCYIDGHQKRGARTQMYKSIMAESYSVGDIEKDDSGTCADFFSEQGSSASQMTAARVMDVIARLPDCDGQAADAVSAHTQVKMEDAPRLPQIRSQNVQIYRSAFHDTSGRNHGQTLKIWSFFLNGTCTDTHLQDWYGKDGSRKFCWSLDGKKVQNWECLFVRRKQGLFLSVYVDDTKNGWKEAECGSHVEEIDEKNVDLDEPTSFLGYVHFGMHST